MTSAHCGGPVRLLVVALLLAAALPARAAIIRVPTDVFSLPNAIAEAAPGDTVRLAGNGGSTYPVSNLTIDKDLRIEGGWRIDFQVRDPRLFISVLRDTTSNLTRDRPVVRILGSPTVEFDGVEILDGRFGILAEEGANLSLRDCRFSGHRNVESGLEPQDNIGLAVRLVGGSFTAVDVLVENMITGYSGGAFGLISCTATLDRVRIFNTRSLSTSQAERAGAVYARDCDLTIRDSEFDTTATVQIGGAVYASESNVTVERCFIVDCLGSASGGAVAVEDCGTVIIRECELRRNRGADGAGLLALRTADLRLIDCTLEENRTSSAGFGGGAYLEDTSFQLSGNRFAENFQSGVSNIVAERGGGVYAIRSVGTVSGDTFYRERAANGGGGWSQVGGDVTIRDVRFEGCFSNLFGGAVSIELGGVVRLERTLITESSAQFGGALSASFTGDIELDHCTVTKCTAFSAGAVLYVDTDAEIRATNSIFCCADRGEVTYCGSGRIDFEFCNVWNDDASNTRAEFGGTCEDRTGALGNQAANPWFCPEDPDYRIQAGSPLQGAASDGSDLGWMPAGCPRPALSVQEMSWGRIKAGYRSR